MHVPRFSPPCQQARRRVTFDPLPTYNITHTSGLVKQKRQQMRRISVGPPSSNTPTCAVTEIRRAVLGALSHQLRPVPVVRQQHRQIRQIYAVIVHEVRGVLIAGIPVTQSVRRQQHREVRQVNVAVAVNVTIY